ncbi:MAG: hypothetical protein JSW67_10835 [Candidatus Latescibacterota bacterium]|nr:MAG: hypothetical protein JSW67_10835 [Candidatus Latescibacterota bacterium]
MQKTPALLIDDPEANDLYDLQRTLRGWKYGLAAVVRAVGAEEGAQASADTSAFAAKNDSLTTKALKSAGIRYRVSGKGIPEREFLGSEGAEVVRALASPTLVVVSFVSNATYPLLVALARDDATRDFLRVGVTGVRMDTAYNLARKLMFDGDISYHEHTRAVERVLCSRLELMLGAHDERLRSA